MIFQCLPETHNNDREGAAQQNHEDHAPTIMPHIHVHNSEILTTCSSVTRGKYPQLQPELAMSLIIPTIWGSGLVDLQVTVYN